MSSIVFTASESVRVGYAQSANDLSYSGARDSASSESVWAPGLIVVGQRYFAAWGYTIWRGGVCFDTSELDNNALIKSATLVIERATAGGLVGKDIRIMNGQPFSIPMIVTDYDRTLYSGNGGEATVGEVLTFNLTSEGLSWIDKTDYTKFMLMSLNDINGEPPTDGEKVTLDISSSYPAKLTVEYYLPSDTPVVTSVGPCTDRQATTMTAVGNVTDDGGGYTARGFEYYEYDEDFTYDAEMYAVREIGVFTGTGEYGMTIYGLKPGTTYYIRAWVLNSFGISYGEWYTCVTTGLSSYDVYEEETTPTICFYVSEDSGHTWSMKFGPYTANQTNIEITKILVRGSGRKQIKFTTDTKTGISASVLCKLDIKTR